MEGYLKKLVKRTFSSPTFERVWVVVDRQQLYHYEKLDLQAQVAVNIKGVAIIKNAIVTKLGPGENGASHGIKIVTTESAPITIVLECGDPNICNSWFMALIKAVTIHKEEEEHFNMFQRCCEQLCIDVESRASLSKESISRAYKKLALVSHPDRGGDIDNFSKLNQAYTNLLAIQAEEDEKKSSVFVDYEAVIEKVEGIGLGIVVSNFSTSFAQLGHEIYIIFFLNDLFQHITPPNTSALNLTLNLEVCAHLRPPLPRYKKIACEAMWWCKACKKRSASWV